MAKAIYQLLFANQSVDSKVRYELVRETKMYVFLREITKEPYQTPYIFRVHKKTLSVKGIKEGKNVYKFDVADARSLKKV